MKKSIAIVLLALVMLMLAACGSRTPAAPSIIETESTQPTQPETQPTQATQPTAAPTQPTTSPTQPAVPLEYTGIYWRTWNEEIAGTVAVRNSYYVLNADHTGYVIAQAVGTLTWTESQVKDNLGQVSRIALNQENGDVNLVVYEFQGNPSVYKKIAKLPAEIESMIAEATKPTPVPAPTVAPRVSAPEITKNPTSETVTEGGNAYFVARANNYNTINWYVVSADHSTRIPVNNAPWNFSGVAVSGEGTTTLLLSNIPLAMNGWGVEAVFTGEGGSSTTSQSFIYVNKAAKTPLTVLPSSGIYVADKPVQLSAAPGSFISYELYDDVGNKSTGTVQSGGYVNIPLIPNCRYVARLVAYVVGNENDLIVCEYTMDGMASQPEPAPGFYGGTFRSEEAEVTLVATGGDSFAANVSIFRLCNMDGYGSYSNGIVYLSMPDASGNNIRLEYNVNNGTLYVSSSTWEYLPTGTSFSGLV